MTGDSQGIVTEPTAPEPFERLIEKARRSYIPLTIHWELTGRCNLHCVHCYVPPDDGDAELTTQQCFDVLDQLADAGTLWVSLSGGEPLLRPDFFEIAEYARRREFALRLMTNGTLIDAVTADALSSLRLMSVEISVYAASASVHDCITGCEGSFELATGALRLMRERGLTTVMKTPVMTLNAAGFEATRRLAQQLADRHVYDVTIIPAKDGDRRPLASRLTPDQLRSFFEGRVGAELPKIAESAFSKPPCGAGIRTASIAPNGVVYPCVAFDIPTGDLRRQSFVDIWQHSPALRQLRQTTFGDIAICASCETAGICGRCSALAHLEDGDRCGPSSAACMVAAAKLSVMSRNEREGGNGH